MSGSNKKTKQYEQAEHAHTTSSDHPGKLHSRGVYQVTQRAPPQMFAGMLLVVIPRMLRQAPSPAGLVTEWVQVTQCDAKQRSSCGRRQPYRRTKQSADVHLKAETWESSGRTNERFGSSFRTDWPPNLCRALGSCVKESCRDLIETLLM